LTVDEAIRDLLDVSTDVLSVAVVDDAGAVVAAGPADAASGLGEAVEKLWLAAHARGETSGPAALDHILVRDRSGSVAVLSHHGHRIVARTVPDPAVGLLLFDLRTCLGDAFSMAGDEA
jgi:hypothetical protein